MRYLSMIFSIDGEIGLQDKYLVIAVNGIKSAKNFQTLQPML